MVNKKIILSVLIIGCIATVAGAGTWAYYSTSATSSNNSFTAGNLTLKVTAEIGDKEMIPGTNLGDQNITVVNDGDLTIGNTTIDFKIKGNGLGHHIKFDSVLINGDEYMGARSLSDLDNKRYVYDKPLPKGDTIEIILKGLNMPFNVDNTGQGKKCQLEVTFVGYQEGVGVPK